jgi:hypothetical protein
MADLVEALNLITSSRIGELYSSRDTEVRGLSPVDMQYRVYQCVKSNCAQQMHSHLVRC